MDILNNYPEVAKQIEILCQSRRDEILSQMVETDCVYRKLCQERADSSMKLRVTLDDTETSTLFERYSYSLYAQEVYELDAIYRQAIYDVLKVLGDQGLI